jgi:carbamate kinase
VRVVVALGGNALLRRGEAMTTENQRHNVRAAAQALLPVAREHALVVSHGNGPQVGLLALQAEAYAPAQAYPLDVLGAESEGMIGYLIEQELGSLLPDRTLATVLTMVEVDPGDPAFRDPTKPIGPIYESAEARRIQAERGWTFRPEGRGFRRVVASPRPKRVLEIQAIRWLLDRGVIVICAGGGGIPTVRRGDGRLDGADGVIDKDRASALLADELDAELLILATDVDAVYSGWGDADARPLGEVKVSDLGRHAFDPGSMGPKVEAACRFVERPDRPRRRAVIGALTDIEAMANGRAGTRVLRDGVP